MALVCNLFDADIEGRVPKAKCVAWDHTLAAD
eukprot:CAMPEP_0115742856 /NCGR_PEP_ID=MMETSP0272-20121206/90756_1 /TAXON_ID=71861 /ORGANISM="Scrippsiella trochoidea, Strain CCMP3099" /LENGTH=31 /DNA_ID= /DNA_START= /DNA_END= /DNA_ORIENTATION=